MIKMWLDRLPARFPESMIDCAMMQIACMAAEIEELRAELAMKQAAYMEGFEAAKHEARDAYEVLRAECDSLSHDAARYTELRTMSLRLSLHNDTIAMLLKDRAMLDETVATVIKGDGK